MGAVVFWEKAAVVARAMMQIDRRIFIGNVLFGIWPMIQEGERKAVGRRQVLSVKSVFKYFLEEKQTTGHTDFVADLRSK